MTCCFQFREQNILEHGKSVNSYFTDLFNFLTKGSCLRYTWRLPAWINDPILLDYEYNLELIKFYHIYHDCGKPFCLTIDELGRQHFPDHTIASRNRWLQYSNDCEESKYIAELIEHDMDFHLLNSENILEFANNPNSRLLLLTGLSELHSNAMMFGGLESTSFKIKWKNADRFGKRIIKHIKGEING